MELDSLFIDYTRFNAQRTLSTEIESEFRVEAIGNSLALIDDTRPCPGVCNRILGFNSSETGSLPELLSLYRDRQPRFDLDTHTADDSGTTGPLTALGYQSQESLRYLTAVPAKISPSEIHVERRDHDRADDFLNLLNRAAGRECLPSIWEKRQKFYCTDTFRTFVAIQDGEPCAWATLFVSENAGVLANAFTFEDFRGRGCHSELIRCRLSDAFNLGLEYVATDVLPGTISLRNCMNNGFEPAFEHAIWQPDES